MPWIRRASELQQKATTLIWKPCQGRAKAGVTLQLTCACSIAGYLCLQQNWRLLLPTEPQDTLHCQFNPFSTSRGCALATLKFAECHQGKKVCGIQTCHLGLCPAHLLYTCKTDSCICCWPTPAPLAAYLPLCMAIRGASGFDIRIRKALLRLL